MFEIALKKKKEEEEEKKIGSSFGGGWNLSELIKEQEPKPELEPDKPVTPEAVKGEPSVEVIEQKEEALKKVEDQFQTLDTAIETDYKRYQELGKQLDDLGIQITEAPEELQWNLSLKYENLRTEHNNLVDKLKAETTKQKELYQDYNVIRGSYEKDLETYNRWAAAQNKL